MSASKPKSSFAKKRMALHSGAASLMRQGSLATFIERYSTKTSSLDVSQPLKFSRSKAPLQEPERQDIRRPYDLRRRAHFARNRSWTEIYSHSQVDMRSSVGAGEAKDPDALNQALNTRLREVTNPTDAKEVLAAFQKTFEDIIEEIPTHSLILHRIKSGYEDNFSKLLEKQPSSEVTLRRQISDMQEILELQQTEKQTLLDTVMQLRKEITALNSNLLRKTSKISKLEQVVLEVSAMEKSHSKDSQFSLDPAELETQKTKSCTSFLPSKNPGTKGKPIGSFLPRCHIPKLEVPGGASIDMLSPIFIDSEAFVSDKEASRAEIKESLQQFTGKQAGL